MAAVTTHEKLVGLENKVIQAKAALRDGDKVKAYKFLDIAERCVDELLMDLLKYKTYMRDIKGD